MRVLIKTAKNIKLEIHVNPEDKVSDAKKIIETTQHTTYTAQEQKLFFKGQELKDETTLQANNIVENSQIVVMNSEECHGISIVELFYMVYVSHHVVEPEKQLGTISMKVDGIKCKLYDEQKIDMSKPSVEYMDHIPLVDIGPVCYDLELVFDHLFCGAYNGSIKARLGETDDLVKRSIQSVNCNGEISALFGCFANATIATLEVHLLNISASATTNVHGVIASMNSCFDASSATSIHFLKEPPKSIKVCGRAIPLSKSRVGVPLGCMMYVDIALFCDDKLYQGTACFDALIDGVDSQEVAHLFLVKVAWNCNEIRT
ncbi:hypothetical protein POM88_051789 [Heracleum sosnowskyi]|uniref:Ubiquitin-like domain-containing protein n=1 Tax=Heracleum sosnowskyi TaxID=360622 RepID=A0AAD8M415_9APIA|nr:hypothetical protein POM88_051789 [Heracleum sosnowskyi]